MTATTTTSAPSFSVRIGRTDAEFETQVDREWSIDGTPFVVEYLALPWDATVKETRHSEGTADTYAAAAAAALLVASTSPARSIIMFSVCDGTGMSFTATGWEPREDALALLARLANC